MPTGFGFWENPGLSINAVLNGLLEHCGREEAERATVEALETQLQSRQEVDEFQQPLRQLEERLSALSCNIAAKRREDKSLEAELQTLLVTSDDELSRKNVDRKR